jgi:hypothetical protein
MTAEVEGVDADVVGDQVFASLVYSATNIIPPKVRAFLDFTQEFLGDVLES